jgi:hypothetical protein
MNTYTCWLANSVNNANRDTIRCYYVEEAAKHFVMSLIVNNRGNELYSIGYGVEVCVESHDRVHRVEVSLDGKLREWVYYPATKPSDV